MAARKKRTMYRTEPRATIGLAPDSNNRHYARSVRKPLSTSVPEPLGTGMTHTSAISLMRDWWVLQGSVNRNRPCVVLRHCIFQTLQHEVETL